MFEPKYKLSYDERRIIIMSLIEMKNRLISENRYTDATDDIRRYAGSMGINCRLAFDLLTVEFRTLFLYNIL